MKLKSLEISGFKSFADKTKIEFKPGMTGIVGPNGSGKSNIIEAIRWVMGEQSAKGLRGEKMQDVIFGGTSKRSPLNRAEVTIIFDNSDHYLKTDFTEIRISRRLYRSGESNYLINGQDVRLRDIVELFMDTGLGRESFSIISQGRVEAIFNSKAEDRRTIIEEVAGVFKYKQSKERAQKELKQTQENLDRVQDILQEVEARVEPLKQQATVAEDYLTQKQQYDALEKSRLVIEIDEYLTATAAMEIKIAELTAMTDQQKITVDEKGQMLKRLKVNQQKLTDEREQLQSKLLTLTQTTERLHGLQNITAEREQTRIATIADLEENLAQSQQTLTTVQQQFETKKQILVEQQAKIDAVAAELAVLTKQTSASRIEQLKLEITTLENSHLTNVKRQINLQNDVEHAEVSLSQASTNDNDLLEQGANLRTQLALATETKENLQSEFERAKQQQQQIQVEFEEVTQAYQATYAEHKKSQQAWFEGLALIKQAQARLESLQTLESEYSGYYQGVRNLMRQRHKFAGIAGVVADLLNVPAELSKAIEVTLGGAVQQVVVDNEQTAKDAVKFLTSQRLGRVTFLPLSVIKGRSLAEQQLNNISNLDGFIGVASELVACDNKYQSIVSHLLGTTVIAKDIDAATIIARQGQHRLKVVTLDGQVINPGGSITGGAQKNDNHGVLQQKTEMDQLSHAVATMNIELAANEAKVKTLAEQVNQLTESGTLKRSELASCNETVQILTSKLDLAQGQVNHLEGQVTELQNQQHAVADSRTLVFNQKAANEQTLKELELTLANELQQIEANKAEIVELTQNQDALSTQIYDKREWLAGQRATVQATQNQVSELEAQISAVEEKQVQLQQRLKLFNVSGDELFQAGQRAQNDLVVAQKNYELTNQQLSAVKNQLAEIEVKTTTVENELDRVQGTFQLSLQELNEVRTAYARIATLLEQSQKQLITDYNLTLDAAKVELVALPIDEIKTQLKLIKRGLDELGDVNIGAIAEYQEVAERFEFLSSQQADLIAARDNLFATMNEMDDEVKVRFQTTFDAIANQFSRIFGQMFGGGKAELRLTDPDNILTTGIDIMAQPPGKKFQQMSLLSGGEKALTAITLLFAILAVRPVPFAILDETEAALDDANVTRFAEYLRTFQNETQFIVITHRKGTMINADVLYGITMQESGISKMVTVNLADIRE